MKKTLDIRPDTGVYGTYKRISYQPWTALAEFVDNSTQSFYDHKKELFTTKYYKGLEIEIKYKEDKIGGDSIQIIDNAYGMEYSDFKRALILDRPPKNINGRNEFGMGLKVAACWFGSLWTVESTCLGSRYKYTAEIDVDNLVRYKSETIDIEEEIVNSKEHYTIITIQKLNKKIKGKRIEKKVKNLLSSTYRMDLRKGNIKIYYNGEPLSFSEVEAYIDQDKKEWKKDISFVVPFQNHELEVNGFIGIRIPGSVPDAGFTLIRRGRVIVGGPEKNYRPSEIFGASNTFPYQRLYGEINMDNWPVTQAKDDFDWSNEDLEATFIEKMKEISADYKQKADEIRTREKTKPEEIIEDLRKTSWPTDSISNINFSIKEDTHNISSHETENQNENQEIDDFKNAVELETIFNTDGVQIINNKTIKMMFNHDQKSYIFEINLNEGNKNSNWMNVTNLNDENAYEININSQHSFFYPFINKKEFLIIMIKFSVSLALAEIELYSIAEDGKVYPPDIRLSMNKILEEVNRNE